MMKHLRRRGSVSACSLMRDRLNIRGAAEWRENPDKQKKQGDEMKKEHRN